MTHVSASTRSDSIARFAASSPRGVVSSPRDARYPDLAFPQHLNLEVAPSGWRPQFLDYLFVGFTTANAFSPTDTMPMVHRAKVAMGSQALISFVVVGLVLARAVNVFT